MSRSRIVVTFDDGTTQEFNPNRPRYLLDMEKRYGVQVPERHEHIAWLAHHVLAPDKPLDEWIDTVDDIDTIEIKDEGDQGKADQP